MKRIIKILLEKKMLPKLLSYQEKEEALFGELENQKGSVGREMETCPSIQKLRHECSQ